MIAIAFRGRARVLLKIYSDRIAEIVLEDSEHAPDAMDLARVLLARGLAAARIVRKPGSSGPGLKPLNKQGA